MPRGATITVENQFVRGLITEYTAMNFPENAVTEADNCVFSELGRVTRRLGMDYEIGYQVRSLSGLIGSTPVGDEAYKEFEWYSVGNDGSVTFIVQQIGMILRFFALSGSSSVSSGLKSFSVNLASYLTAGSTAAEARKFASAMTSGDGYLFVAHRFCDPIYISYNQDTDSITTNRIDIEIRDMGGLDDGLETDFRPTTLSSEHYYNVLNQGWYLPVVAYAFNTPTRVLDIWRAHRNNADWPSNADIWWLHKDAVDIAYLGNRREGNRTSPEQKTLGNTPAPKGHYIYSPFNVDRSAKTGIPGLPVETSGRARPSSICWYAGRVWYAGTGASKYSSTLYYSQLIEAPQQFGRCYQVNDPTSETTFDLLDTDGGTISLPLIEQVVSMKVINDALVILGTNAIYVVRGADNGPFRATNYVVQYSSSIGAVSDLSVVAAEGSIIWFNYDGIYSLGGDQLGNLTAGSVSKQTIQSVFDDIPVQNRDYIKGVYNQREQTVRWIYSDDDNITGFRYNRILDLNVASKAFYTHTIATSLAPKISGLIATSGQTIQLTSENVVDSLGVNVTDSLGAIVTVQARDYIPNQDVFKFTTVGAISSGSQGLTYSELNSDDYVDFESFNSVGVPYVSYGVSGYRVRGEMLRPFNSTPVAFVVENLENGRLVISGIWDYGFRQSRPHELYLTRPEVNNIIRRIKIRGKGKSLQLKFESVGNNPFSLVGWSTFDSGGTMP